METLVFFILVAGCLFGFFSHIGQGKRIERMKDTIDDLGRERKKWKDEAIRQIGLNRAMELQLSEIKHASFRETIDRITPPPVTEAAGHNIVDSAREVKRYGASLHSDLERMKEPGWVDGVPIDPDTGKPILKRVEPRPERRGRAVASAPVHAHHTSSDPGFATGVILGSLLNSGHSGHGHASHAPVSEPAAQHHSPPAYGGDSASGGISADAGGGGFGGD